MSFSSLRAWTRTCSRRWGVDFRGIGSHPPASYRLEIVDEGGYEALLDERGAETLRGPNWPATTSTGWNTDLRIDVGRPGALPLASS